MPDEPLGWSTLLGLGCAAAGMLAAGIGLGWVVDRLAHTAPICLLVGTLIGIVAAIVYTVVVFRSYLRE